MDEKLLLGVDGGGTKTEVWLARTAGDGEPTVIGRGKSASSNPRAVGLSTALANLAQAIEAAWQDAALPPKSADCAVLAMSGAGHAAVRDQIRSWAERRNLARRIEQVHDADPVLAAGTPEGWGVALIVGTGSAAVGVDRAGRREVVGGWGYWFGDEGSAYWLGRSALEFVAQAADGRRPPTQLTDAVLGKLQISDPRAILSALEATGNVRGAIADLAPAVSTAAAAGDVTAQLILNLATKALGQAVASLAERLFLGVDFPLALTGGVVCGSDIFREFLERMLKGRGMAPASITLVTHPAAGCLRFAQRALAAAP